MKQFNKSLNHDITQLKKLHALKDKTEFNKMKSEIMKRHSISKATVYRELKKDTPGSYDRKRSERPVTIKEIQMVRELLEQQYKVQDVISVMERKTGMPYSWDRIDKIREAIDNGQLTVDSGSESRGVWENGYTPSATGGHPSPHHRCDPEGNNESAFGDNLRVFIDELMDSDRIAEGDYITVNLDGVPYRLSRKIVKDITMIITNYAECWLSAVQFKPPDADDEEYLLFRNFYIKDDEPLPPIEELVTKQEAVLRKFYGPGGMYDLEREPENTGGVTGPSDVTEPCDITELNRIRIFHLVADKIRSAVSGSFITLKELKELNEMNRYFKESGEY